MKKIVPAPCYTMRVKFKNIEKELFYHVVTKECDRIKSKLQKSSSKDLFLDITDIDGNFVYINIAKLQSIYFLYEARPFEIEAEESDWEVEINLDNAEPNFIPVDSPETVQDLYNSIYTQSRGNYTTRFFRLQDVDEEEFFFNRDEVVYFKIPKECFEDFDDEDYDDEYDDEDID